MCRFVVAGWAKSVGTPQHRTQPPENTNTTALCVRAPPLTTRERPVSSTPRVPMFQETRLLPVPRFIPIPFFSCSAPPVMATPCPRSLLRGGVEDSEPWPDGSFKVSVAADFEHLTTPVAATHHPRRLEVFMDEIPPGTSVLTSVVAAPAALEIPRISERPTASERATAVAQPVPATQPEDHVGRIAPVQPHELDLGTDLFWDKLIGDPSHKQPASEPAAPEPTAAPAWLNCRCGECAGCTMVADFTAFDWDL